MIDKELIDDLITALALKSEGQRIEDATTDAAQAREEVLREAAKVRADAAFNCWAEAEKPVSQRKYGGAGLPASVSLAILALIGDNNNNDK